MGLIDNPFDVSKQPIAAHEFDEVISQRTRRHLREMGMTDHSLDAMDSAVTQTTQGWDMHYEEGIESDEPYRIQDLIWEYADAAVPDYYDARWELYVGLRAYISGYGEPRVTTLNSDLDMNEMCGIIISNIAQSLLELGSEIYRLNQGR